MIYLVGIILFIAGLAVGFVAARHKEAVATSALDRHAEFAVRQVQEKFGNESGEFKRSQGLRMLLNITTAAERDCSLALEKAVHRCLAR